MFMRESLVDKEVTDRLVDEAYARSKQEIDISHIMVTLASSASSSQEKKALEKILNDTYSDLDYDFDSLE